MVHTTAICSYFCFCTLLVLLPQSPALANRPPGWGLGGEVWYDNATFEASLKPFARIKLPPPSPSTAVIFYRCENRISDLRNLRLSLELLDLTFNSKAQYPVIIFHEGFSNTTKYDLQEGLSFQLQFEFVEPINVPSFLDASAIPESISSPNGRESWGFGYRTMQRFMEGLVFFHPALVPYSWALRLDTDSYFLDALTIDPIRTVYEQDQVYGYITMQYESRFVVEGFWEVVRGFLRTHFPMGPPALFGMVGKRNTSLGAVVNSVLQGDWTARYRYNRLKYYSNFEVLRLDFFRSREYQSFFRWIDRSGLIFTKRLGAPIRTLGVALYLQPRDLHHFHYLAYMHQSLVTPQVKHLSVAQRQLVSTLWQKYQTRPLRLPAGDKVPTGVITTLIASRTATASFPWLDGVLVVVAMLVLLVLLRATDINKRSLQ